MTHRVRVLYITGSGRSGSTLLERMLGHLPGLLPVGELENVWTRGFEESELCSCGCHFVDCDFWETVASSAFGGFDRAPSRRLASLVRTRARIRYVPEFRFLRLRTRSFRADLLELRAGLTALYRGLLTASGATTIVDSSKSPAYAYLLTTIPDLEIYFIHLVRDSRAVCYSWQKKVLRPEVTSRPAYMGGFHPAASARRWNLRNSLAESLKYSTPRYMRIRYEDLVDAPRRTLEKVIRMTMTGDVPLPDFGEDPPHVDVPPTYHTVSGNPIRFAHETIAVRPDNEWHEKLGTNAKIAVSAITLPLLVHYGYKPSTGLRANQRPR
jgi:hypothetical protein